MITNASLTLYHKGFDESTRLEKWVRFNYGDDTTNTIWWFGGKGANTNKGYENANDVQIRIPYDLNSELNINDFSIGDIVVKGYITDDIETQQDLQDYDVYNITAINNNDFGNTKHIHLSGR